MRNGSVRPPLCQRCGLTEILQTILRSSVVSRQQSVQLHVFYDMKQEVCEICRGSNRHTCM